jgi:hypothetical protein
MYDTNEVNGAYVSGTEVNPDHPSMARKTKTATRTPRIVNAANRVMAANVRSPRRVVGGVVSGPAFSGETVAVTWAPVVLEGEDRVRRPSPEGDRRTRLDQLAAI